MAKTREKKNELISNLRANLNSKKSAFLVDYKGLKVSEIQEMRRKLRDESISFEVVKNSLFKIALNKEEIALDKSLLDRPLALSFADDEVTLSKQLVASAKEHEAMEILGGFIDKKFVGEEIVKELSLLPGRDELYAKFVGSLNSPISGLVNALAGNIRNLVNVLNNYKATLNGN